MANDITIVVSSKDEASHVFKNIATNAGGLGKALGDVSKIASGLVLGSGIMQAPGFLMSAAQAAADDEQSMNRLKQAVENTGVSFDSFSGALNTSISAAQKHAFTDDEARSSLALLMAQTGNADEAMRRFALAQDVARGAGIPLETASRLLGKVTADNVEVFKKMGITLGEGASEADAFAALQTKFAGQADVYANSTAGQFEQAKIQMGELKERIGSALMPAMAELGQVLVNDVIPAFNTAGDWLELHLIPAVKEIVKNDVLPTLKEALAQLKQTIDGLMPVATDILKWFQDNPVAIAAVTAALGLLLVALFPIPAAVAAIVAGGVLLLAHWDDIKTKVGELLTKFQTDFPLVWLVVETVWNDIKNKVELTWGLIKGFIDVAMALFHGDFKLAWEGIQGMINTVWDGIKTDIGLKIGLILGVVTGAVPAMLEAGKGLMNAVLGGIQDIWNNYVWPFLAGLPGLISGLGPSLAAVGFAAGQAVMQGLVDGVKSLAGVVPGIANDIGSALKSWINQNVIDKINRALEFTIKIKNPVGPDPTVTINPPDIPHLAGGGIVRQPTFALIGEAGPEAVIPLTGPNRGGFGGDIHIHIHISAIDGESVRRVIPKIAAELQRHMRTMGAVGMIA